jgi:hypothetical protein
VELRTSAGTVAQLFWSDDPPNFLEDRSIRVPLQPARDEFQRLRFLLPSKGVRWIRFDPTDAPGEVLIRQMHVLDSRGRILRAFDSETLKPANQIASMARHGEATRLVTEPAATDPFVYASLGCLNAVSPSDSLLLVTLPTVTFTSLAVVVLLGACVVALGVDAFGRGRNRDAPQANGASWRLSALWLVVLFLAVFSAKLFLMRQNPVTVPFWDQWDGEARAVYLPFNECTLSWSRMFALHNEHRVFFSRLLALDLLLANGQWDPRLQQVVNAALHSLTAVLLVVMLWVANDRRRLDLLVLIGVLAFAPPFSWDNTLVGFQSAFYFLLLFSMLGLWLTTQYPAPTVPWCLGWLCALCALFTAAGGLLLPLAIVGQAALRLALDRREWRQVLFTFVAAAAVLGLGLATASTPLQHHQALKARTVADFAGALAHNLAWPWVGHQQLSVLMWLPVVSLLVVVLLGRARWTLRESFIIGLGLWVLLQAAAVAYGRGAGAPPPATRYQDFLSVGFVANTMALIIGLECTRRGTTWRRAAAAALVGWLLVAAVGVDRLARGALVNLDAWRPYWSAHAANVRRFLITGDLADFTSRKALQELPYPDAHSLANVLQEPYIRRILPSAVRISMPVDARSDSWFSFREPVETGRASRATEWLIAASPELLLIVVAMALLAARWT